MSDPKLPEFVEVQLGPDFACSYPDDEQPCDPKRWSAGHCCTACYNRKHALDFLARVLVETWHDDGEKVNALLAWAEARVKSNE